MMKKDLFEKGLGALGLLVLSVYRSDLVFGFYNWVIPTSSMQGQEIWVVLFLFALHYIVLIAMVVYVGFLTIKRLINNYKGGN